MASSSSSGKGSTKETPTESGPVFENKFDPLSKSPHSTVSAAGGTSSGTELSEKSENEDLASFQKKHDVNAEIHRLQEQTHVMDRTLASLNLPAALKDFADRQKVPQSVIDSAQRIKDMGGIQFLCKQMTELSELLDKNKQILKECIKMIDDEKKSDQCQREKYKEKWTQPSSDELNQQFREENTKCLKMLKAAFDTYNSVQREYEEVKPAIELLSKSTQEIGKALLSGDCASEGSGMVKKLDQLMEHVENIKSERIVLEKEIKEAKLDMTKKSSDGGVLDKEMLDGSELESVYEPLKEKVSKNLQEQESVMSEIQRTSEEFQRTKTLNKVGTQSDSKLKDLATGFDKTMKLTAHLDDKIKFYRDLMPRFDNQREHILKFCSARKEEMRDLKNRIQRSVIKQPTSPSNEESEPASSFTQTAPSKSPDVRISSTNGAQGTQPGPPSSLSDSGTRGTQPESPSHLSDPRTPITQSRPPSGSQRPLSGDDSNKGHPPVQVTEQQPEINEAGTFPAGETQVAKESERLNTSRTAMKERPKTDVNYFIFITWNSKSQTKTKEQNVNLFKFHQWQFFLEKKEQYEKTICTLKNMKAELFHKIEGGIIRITFHSNATFNEEEESKEVEQSDEFESWAKKCLKIANEAVSWNVLLVTIGCKIEDTQVIRDFLRMNSWSTVDIVESKDFHGVCLVGDGDSLITILSEIRRMERFKNTNVWDPHTNDEKEIGMVCLDLINTRCWYSLDLENKVKDQFQSIRMYIGGNGDSLKLIGNKDEVQQVREYITHRKWVKLCRKETKNFDKEIIQFLGGEAVQKYLDDEIRKRANGTWIVSEDKKSVIVYCPDDKTVKEIFDVIEKSFGIEKLEFADWKENQRVDSLLEKSAKLRNDTDGKFCMHSNPAPALQKGVREVCFIYTTDLLNNRDVVNLMDEIRHEAQKSAKYMESRLEFPPEDFQNIKMKKDEILALRQNVDVEFGEGNALILRGDKDSVSDIKKYIKGLKFAQKCVFLPEILTLNQTAEKLSESHNCILKKLHSNPESRVWIKNNFIFIAYLGEPREDLPIDSRAVLEFSSRDIKSKCSLKDPSGELGIFTIRIPTITEGKGMHSTHESFTEAFNQMMTFKKKCLLIPLKAEGTWPTKKLVKGILYPLIQLVPNETITIILCSNDRHECAVVNRTIQEAFQVTNEKDQPSKIEFEVKKSEITKEKVDVIVNTISNDLDLKIGAVSHSIWKAARHGSDLQTELRKKNNNQTSVEYGEVLETNSYGLPCQRIFHGALRPWDTTEKDSSCKKIMQTFVRSCLEKANGYQFSSLAFPALGTGNLNFPPDVVARLIKETVRQFENDNPKHSVSKIVFIIYFRDEQILKEFKDVYEKAENEDNAMNKQGALPDLTEGTGLEEMVVCGLEDDVKNVVEKLNQQMQSEAKLYSKPIKTDLTEPSKQEITNRRGTESSEAGADQNHDRNQSSSSKRIMEQFDDTGCCKIASFKDKKALDENSVLFERKPRAIICPFGKKTNEALVVFDRREDAEKFFENPGQQLNVRHLEQQAVQNIEAQISMECLKLFPNLQDFEDSLIKCSGVWIKKSNENRWILWGNLPQIELAHKCIEEMISGFTNKERGLSSTVRQGTRKTSIASLGSAEGPAEEIHCVEHISMTEEEYARYITLFELSGNESDGTCNIRYENQCACVSGNKSFVQNAKKQLTKKIFARDIDVSENMYKEIEADIRQLKQDTSKAEAFWRAKDRKIEVLGMSKTAVDNTMKLLESKIDSIKECSRDDGIQTFCTNEGLVIKVYKGNIEEIDVNCVINFTQSREHHQIKATRGSEGDRKEGHCYYVAKEKAPYKSKIQACMPDKSSKLDEQTPYILKNLVLKALDLADGKRITSVGIPLYTVLQSPDLRTYAEMYASAVIEFSSCHQTFLHLGEIHITDEVQSNVACIAKVFDEAFQKAAKNYGSTQLPTSKASKDFLPSIETKNPNRAGYNLRSNFKVYVYEGDILLSDVDAICCGQDSGFQSKSHIAKSVTDQYKDIEKLLSKEKVKRHQIGHVLMTECQVYSAKNIIFVVTSKEHFSYKDPADKSLKDIKKCFTEVLKFADKNKVVKLALPLLGTGDTRVSRSQIAHVWVDSIKEFLGSKKSSKNLKEVHCVNHDKHCIKIVQDDLCKYFKSEAFETSL